MLESGKVIYATAETVPSEFMVMLVTGVVTPEAAKPFEDNPVIVNR